MPAGERGAPDATPAAAPVPADRAAGNADAIARLKTGIAELDRVLGGGLVPGSVVLLGGAPGIGKSTLLLQACAGLCAAGTVLYASGEESVDQIGSRARRLDAAHAALLLLAETRSEAILDVAERERPAVLVVDSIQTVHSVEQDGLPGNLGQIRSVAGRLVAFAKSHGLPVVVVGHVTKDGQLAGPRLLEHMVDTVLSFEGEDERPTRLLRATKNRFGDTQELGVFEMTGTGLREVANPSRAFLAERAEQAPGSCVTATLEGSRPLLLEVQALLGAAPGGSPRRTCVGADPSRVAMLLAVLDRHAGLFVLDQDVFVNVAGGLRLREPAADLTILLAIASSHRRQPVAAGMIVIGEVGLTGELRRVPRLDPRLHEAARLGFTRAVVPAGLRESATSSVPALTLLEAPTVARALELAFD
jgi:DNA repair protein RadA/Sms